MKNGLLCIYFLEKNHKNMTSVHSIDISVELVALTLRKVNLKMAHCILMNIFKTPIAMKCFFKQNIKLTFK